MARKIKLIETPAIAERQSFKCPICGKENFGPICLSCGAMRENPENDRNRNEEKDL